MDSVQLMDARGSIVSFFPCVGRRRRYTRRDSSHNQPLAAGGATGRSGEGSEKREDGRVVRADEPRGSAPIHRRFRSRVSLPQGVEVLTSGPQRLLNRILTEHRAGKYNYDTLNIRSSALYTLKKANAIIRYDTPYRTGLRAGFYDKEGYFNGIWASLLVYLFNTKQVSCAQAPKSVDDLLQPQWKGKLGMDQDVGDWLAALLDFYGDEKGKQIARSLGSQNLNIRKGRTLVSQLVAAGEFPVQIDAHHHEAVSLRQSGAPIDYIFPEPFIPVKAVSAFVMSSQPPHPHAAALLVDFMLSKKGQELAFRQKRWPAFKELAAGGPDDVGNRNTVVPDADKWGSRYQELVQLSAVLGR